MSMKQNYCQLVTVSLLTTTIISGLKFYVVYKTAL